MHGRRHKPLRWLLVFLFFAFVIFKIIYTLDEILHYISVNPTLVFLSVTACMAYLSWVTQRHLTRAKHTMDFQGDFSDSEHILKATAIYKTKINLMTKQELIDLAKNDLPSEELDSLKYLLNTWERVGIAVRYDVYDDEMLYETYGTFLLKLCVYLHPYIKQRQSGNVRTYANLMWLYLSWKVRRQEGVDAVKQRKLKKALSDLEKALDLP